MRAAMRGGFSAHHKADCLGPLRFSRVTREPQRPAWDTYRWERQGKDDAARHARKSKPGADAPVGRWLSPAQCVSRYLTTDVHPCRRHPGRRPPSRRMTSPFG
jgi:hypothetical protein